MTKYLVMATAAPIAVLIATAVLMPPRLRGVPYSPFYSALHSAIAYTCAAVVIAVIWAICFRRQLELGRISLWSLLILVAMEAMFPVGGTHF